MMTLNPLLNRNSRLMNFLESYPTNKTGSGLILFLTTKNAMEKPLNQPFVELNVTFLMNVPAQSAMLLSLTLLGMMVRRNRR